MKKTISGILLSAILLNSGFQISANAMDDKIKNSNVQSSNIQDQESIYSKLAKLIPEIDQATLHANDEPSPENWNYVSALCNQAAQIYLSIGNQDPASFYSDRANKATAKLFEAEANIAWEEAQKNPTDINWENASDLFAKAAQEYNELDKYSSEINNCCDKALWALAKSAETAAKNAEKLWSESKTNQWKRAETLFNKLYNSYLFLNKQQEAQFAYSHVLFTKFQDIFCEARLNPSLENWKKAGDFSKKRAEFYRDICDNATQPNDDSFISKQNFYFQMQSYKNISIEAEAKAYMCYAMFYHKLATVLKENSLPKVSGSNSENAKRLDILKQMHENYSKAADLAKQAALLYADLRFEDQSCRAEGFHLLCQTLDMSSLAKIKNTAQAWKIAADSAKICHDYNLLSLGAEGLRNKLEELVNYTNSMYEKLSKQ